MQTHALSVSLKPHPLHPPKTLKSITARVIGLDANWLRLRWRLEGTQDLVVPSFSGRGRADELWKTTCFEAFLRPNGGTAYVELNLSPSERWAAYDFDSYRDGARNREFPREPDCTIRQGTGFSIFDAAVPLQGLPQLPWHFGFCAVIEEADGVLSYWAAEHPEGKPDFHDPACFAATLAPPELA